MILENKTAVFLGDSITEGAGTSAEEKRYYEVLKKEYGLKKVYGFGVGGTRIARQQGEDNPCYSEYFSLRADKMPSDADIVVVFGGTNDFGHGDAPIGTFLDRTPDTFYGACRELFEKLINKYPEGQIVILTPLHRLNECNVRGEGNKTKTSGILLDYVNVIKEVAMYYSLPVCDLYANSGMQPNVEIIKEKYIPDGLHPNDKGNEVIAHKLGEFLKSL